MRKAKMRSQTSDTDKFPFDYKGYTIYKQSMGIATYWIQKSTSFIGYCSGLEDGKKIINNLVD